MDHIYYSKFSCGLANKSGEELKYDRRGNCALQSGYSMVRHGSRGSDVRGVRTLCESHQLTVTVLQ
jgi:hypothetical protein